MLLSEAILAGVKHAPLPSRFVVFSREKVGVDLKASACVLGTAAIGLEPALAQLDPRDAGKRIDQVFSRAKYDDLLGSHFLPHPETGREMRADLIVKHLNDWCGWNRERIAGWLAGHGL
jgi:hypothetical protein